MYASTHVAIVTLVVCSFILIMRYGYEIGDLFRGTVWSSTKQEHQGEYKLFLDYSDKHSILELGKRYHYGSNSIKQDHTKAEQMYKLALSKRDYIAFLYLGLLYTDMDDIPLAVKSFQLGVEKGFFQCFYHLGDLYFHQKSIIDLDMAEQYYKAGIKYTHSPEYISLAKEKLAVLLSEKGDSYYTSQQFLLTSTPSSLSLHDGVEEEDGDDDDDDTSAGIETVSKYNLSEQELDSILTKKTLLPGFTETVNGVSYIDHPTLSEHMFQNNPQNVHDYVLSKTTHKSLQSLLENTHVFLPKEQVIEDIRCHMKHLMDNNASDNTHATPNSVHYISEHTATMVENVLDFIEHKDQCYKDTNLTLLDSLHLVWNRIHNEGNEPNKDQLIYQLLIHLSECIEDDSVVCMTGVFTRIIDCLHGSDSESIVKIIPKYALRQELMAKAALISKKWMDGLPSDSRSLFLNPDPTVCEKRKLDELTERLKHKLVSEFKEEYVTKGVIDEDMLYLEIKQWIHYL